MISENSAANDEPTQEVLSWLSSQKNLEQRFRKAIRTAVDEVLDGGRTGRYSIDELTKNEKTYIGTKVEIILQEIFSIPRGKKKPGTKEKPLDYEIQGHEVDCKFTIRETWEIPREAVGKICLLVKVSESGEFFSAGVLRTGKEFLTGSVNSDGKKKVSAHGKKNIEWILERSVFPKSLLLSLSPEIQEYIFEDGTSGQERVNRLFASAQGEIIDGGTIDTAAQQRDSMARAREGDGRARTVLRADGILIAGHWKKHKEVLQRIRVSLPRMPRCGELVSFRVVEKKPWHDNRPSVSLDGRDWVLATNADPHEEAPRLPEVSS